MRKVLLVAINAKYIHSNLAVYSLRAYAKKHGGEVAEGVEIAEFTVNNQPDYILEEIYKKKPDVLFFSCYIWNLSVIEEVSREFHKLCSEVPIWVGGPEVSFEVKDFLQSHPQITGVMMGEGEETFLELCQCYEAAPKEGGQASQLWEQLEAVKGIAYRKPSKEGEEVSIHPWREIMPLSDVPFCYDKASDFSNRIMYYESSRGCPFSCSYCLSSVDKKLRFRSLDLVKEELQFFLDRKVPQVKFVDRTFNCWHEHAMAIWQFIKEKDNGVTNFHFEVSADLLNDKELDLISDMRPGLIQLEIGVQSTNAVTIQEIKRSMKLERLKEVVRQIKSFGNIHQHLDLIAGLPFEDYATFAKSFDEIYALQPEQLQMGFLKVLKGSYMYEHREDYAVLYHDKPPYEVMATKWLSFDDVLRMKRVEEMLEVYYNSGQYQLSMKLLGAMYESAFAMYQKLGDYYECHGLFGMSHSRIRRCEILLDFAKQELGEESPAFAVIKEALVFDIYFRENSKTRPGWAMEAGALKEMTHAYCKNGKMSHVEGFFYDFVRVLEDNVPVIPEKEKSLQWVMFSYDKRDPLSHQAKVERVEEITKG